MDKTLIDYDKNLEELEKQREKLQKVMQMMGQEWEESGAGIGWLGQVDLPISGNASTSTRNTTSSSPLSTPTIVKETSLSQITESIQQQQTTPLSISNQPLFTNILNSQTGPSPEYLQSLLNVNEALLAQSLATPIPQTITPMLSPIEEQTQYSDNHDISPLITPDDLKNTQQQRNYNIDPDSELILSPLTTTTNKQQQEPFNTTIQF